MRAPMRTVEAVPTMRGISIALAAIVPVARTARFHVFADSCRRLVPAVPMRGAPHFGAIVSTGRRRNGRMGPWNLHR
jgi:hypothetical protein